VPPSLPPPAGVYTLGMTQDTWTPDTWRTHEARQLPTYPDAAALAQAEDDLRP